MNHIVNYLEAILSMLRIFLIIELFPYFSSHMMNKLMKNRYISHLPTILYVNCMRKITLISLHSPIVSAVIALCIDLVLSPDSHIAFCSTLTYSYAPINQNIKQTTHFVKTCATIREVQQMI